MWGVWGGISSQKRWKTINIKCFFLISGECDVKRLIYCGRPFRRMHQPLDEYDTRVYNTHLPEWERKIKQFVADCVKLFFFFHVLQYIIYI